MAVHIHAQVTLPYQTGIPEDVAVNNWSFDLADDTGPELGQVAEFLESFYIEISPYLSEILNLEEVVLKFYRRADPIPRSPIGTEVVSWGTLNAVGSLPEEVATCLSFSGVPVSGEPPARRRGRVFIGPLGNNGTVSQDPADRARVTQAFAQDVLSAYETAWSFLTTAGNVHEVWSPTDGEGYPVVRTWMDNAFDTQRRRGPAATSRETTLGPW